MHVAKVAGRAGVAVAGCLRQPVERLGIVAVDSDPLQIGRADDGFCLDDSAFRRCHVQGEGLRVVLGDAFALAVGLRQQHLGGRISVRRGRSQPLPGLDVVLGDTPALRIDIAEFVLRLGIALAGSGKQPFQRLARVRRHAGSALIKLTEPALRRGIAQLRGLPDPRGSGSGINSQPTPLR